MRYPPRSNQNLHWALNKEKTKWEDHSNQLTLDLAQAKFKLVTTDRLSHENDANINYSINYKQQDFSKASSYKLDSLSSGVGINYKLNNNILIN